MVAIFLKSIFLVPLMLHITKFAYKIVICKMRQKGDDGCKCIRSFFILMNWVDNTKYLALFMRLFMANIYDWNGKSFIQMIFYDNHFTQMINFDQIEFIYFIYRFAFWHLKIFKDIQSDLYWELSIREDDLHENLDAKWIDQRIDANKQWIKLENRNFSHTFQFF